MAQIPYMKKQIQLYKQNIEYTVKISKRARRMRLAVYLDGRFVVTVPKNINQGLIERFIAKKSQWIIDKLDYFKNLRNKSILKKEAKFSEYKEQALLLANERIRHFNSFYGFQFNKIYIKNQKTRWGSCSKKGNLNFNFKIALLPQRLADYIAVHELCHLGEFNHSRKFWNLVAKTIPDYSEMRNELKENGMSYY
ncbi:M48 family peptidase [Patescibacteria group bacterium]|nr:MAG: M48 family peptidase [Patescibacteria group bacterium]